jgi:hypothetical protein
MAQSALSGLSPAATARLVEPEALAEQLAAEGRVRVLVEFASPPPPPGQSYDMQTLAGMEVLNAAVARAQERILDRTIGAVARRRAEAAEGDGLGLVRFQTSPMFGLNADAALLQVLANDPEVLHIHIDHEVRPLLRESVPLIGMRGARYNGGATGGGVQTVGQRARQRRRQRLWTFDFDV